MLLQQNETATQVTIQPMREETVDPVPNIPNLPGDLFLKVCDVLKDKDDATGDWRKVAEKLSSTTMKKMQVFKDDSESYPAYVLQNILNNSRAEGSDDPVEDLLHLFTDLELHEASKLVEDWKSNQGE